MTAVQTIALQRIGADHVSVIAPQTWEQFCRGGTPLLPGDRKIDLLLLTLRDGVCEEIDPITLALDENGYLMRFDLQLRPLPKHPALLDARSAFVGRYLKARTLLEAESGTDRSGAGVSPPRQSRALRQAQFLHDGRYPSGSVRRGAIRV